MNDSEHEQVSEQPPRHDPPPAPVRRPLVPLGIGVGVLVLLTLGATMVRRAESSVNNVPLSAAPKPVSTLPARAAQYRASRTYIGTIEPWIEAKIGPQFVSAYVSDVRVRPGDAVKKGDVLATLDCRSANATSKAVSMQAQALEAQQQALAHEAERVRTLMKGGYVSPNEVEQKLAQSTAQKAQLLATQAKFQSTALEVDDCVLRAPFDAEVATRNADPGSFVSPGSSLISLVDRRTVRINADVPEIDFDIVRPGAQVGIHVLATARDLTAKISRRAPAADSATRTIHFELDVPDPERAIPVGTTAELHIDVGEPSPAVAVPLAAAAVRGDKASLFVAQGDVAHARTVAVKGESAGMLYLHTDLEPGSLVITEGRALLEDGDRIAATLEPTAPLTQSPGAQTTSHGT